MKYNKNNLIGKRFGKLLVLEETDKRADKGSIVWKCKCDCGNIVEISSKRLVSRINVSCGCYQKERQKYSMTKLHNKQLIDNTNIDLINKKQANANSKTGIRGVCFIKSKKKYKAFLYINKQYHFLGYYDDINKAIEARKEAEEKYFTPILEKYKKSIDNLNDQ